MSNKKNNNNTNPDTSEESLLSISNSISVSQNNKRSNGLPLLNNRPFAQNNRQPNFTNKLSNNYRTNEKILNKTNNTNIKNTLTTTNILSESQTESDVSKTDTNVSQTDTNVSQTDTNVSQTDTNVSQTDTNVSQTDTNVSQTDTNVSQTETDVSQTETDVSQTDTDVSQTETDVSQTETDVSQTETDVSQTETDVSQTETEESQTETEESQTETQTNNKKINYNRVDESSGVPVAEVLYEPKDITKAENNIDLVLKSLEKNRKSTNAPQSILTDVFKSLKAFFTTLKPVSSSSLSPQNVPLTEEELDQNKKVVNNTKKLLIGSGLPSGKFVDTLVGGFQALHLSQKVSSPQLHPDFLDPEVIPVTGAGAKAGTKLRRKSTVKRLMRHAKLSGELSTNKRVNKLKKILLMGTNEQKKDVEKVLINTYKNTVRVYWKNPQISFNMHPVLFRQYHKLAKKYLVSADLYEPPKSEYSKNRKTNPYVPKHRPIVKKTFSHYTPIQKEAIINFLIRTQERKAHKQSSAQKKHTLDMIYSQRKIKTKKNIDNEKKQKLDKKIQSQKKLELIVSNMQKKKSTRPSDKILQGYFLLGRKEKIIPGGAGAMKKFLSDPLSSLVKILEFMDNDIKKFKGHSVVQTPIRSSSKFAKLPASKTASASSLMETKLKPKSKSKTSPKKAKSPAKTSPKKAKSPAKTSAKKAKSPAKTSAKKAKSPAKISPKKAKSPAKTSAKIAKSPAKTSAKIAKSPAKTSAKIAKSPAKTSAKKAKSALKTASKSLSEYKTTPKSTKKTRPVSRMDKKVSSEKQMYLLKKSMDKPTYSESGQYTESTDLSRGKKVSRRGKTVGEWARETQRKKVSRRGKTVGEWARETQRKKKLDDKVPTITRGNRMTVGEYAKLIDEDMRSQNVGTNIEEIFTPGSEVTYSRSASSPKRSFVRPRLGEKKQNLRLSLRGSSSQNKSTSSANGNSGLLTEPRVSNYFGVCPLDTRNF
jgi:hypothetical protein